MKKSSVKPKPKADDSDSDEAPEKDKTPTRDLSEIPALSSRAEKLENIMRRRDQLSDQIKALTKQQKEFDVRMLLMLKKARVSKVRILGHATSIVSDAGHTMLSKAKLLEQGVSPLKIKKAEVWVPHKEHLRVDPRKKED